MLQVPSRGDVRPLRQIGLRLGLVLLLSSCSLLLAPGTRAAALPNLSPAMIEQLKALPPSQARALAQQYGIDIESALGISSASGPAPGQRIPEGDLSFRPGPFLDIEGTQGIQQRFDSFEEESSEEDTAAALTIEALRASERYGLAFFSSEVSTFSPVDNAPVPQDYRLGPGDELQVLLLGQDSGEYSLLVDRLGEVALPAIGKVSVAGLTVEAASELLKERVSAARIGVQALVSMGRLRAINVMLAGEVRVPGARSLSAMARVSQALFASGGLSDIGSLREIAVKRSGETVGVFDAYELLMEGDSSNDITLRDGDVVFVPPVRRLAGVSGAVRRPGVFELKGRETLEELLAMAGGVTARGRSSEILLEREQESGAPEILVLAGTELAGMVSQAGDRMRIQVAAQRFANRVELRGAVQRPGIYGHFEDMRLSDLLQNPDIDTLETTDLAYGLVVSTDRLTGNIEVRQFSPGGVFASPDGALDLRLYPRDTIILFSRPGSSDAIDDALEISAQEFETPFNPSSRADAGPNGFPSSLSPSRMSSRMAQEFTGTGALAPPLNRSQQVLEELRKARSRAEASSRETLLKPVLEQLARQARPSEPVAIVEVEGAVQAPGRYPLGDAYTAADLIAAAGGVRDDAYLAEVEVQRVVLDEASVASVRTFSIREGGKGLASFKLSSRDRLSIRAIPNWRPEETVLLEGEFRFPGEYALLPGETLGELVLRVGGITNRAFPYGAIYTAELAAETERIETERFADEIRRSYASMALTQQQQRTTFEELEQSIQSLLNREALGRVAIDLPRILAGDEAADVVLADGDKIFMPRRNDTVTVLGEIFRPGSFRFEAGMGLNDYLSLGAGATPRADRGGVYVVRANGQVDRPGKSWFRFNLESASIKPGDTIVVPVDASFRDPLDFWTSITQVAYQTGIAIAAVLRN